MIIRQTAILLYEECSLDGDTIQVHKEICRNSITRLLVPNTIQAEPLVALGFDNVHIVGASDKLPDEVFHALVQETPTVIQPLAGETVTDTKPTPEGA